MYYIYGTENCGFCTRAKEILDSKNEEYTYQDVTMDQGLMDMFKMNGWRTVPQVFYNDKHVGGYKELVKYLES